jgi:PAS domain S-box-containing protein
MNTSAIGWRPAERLAHQRPSNYWIAAVGVLGLLLIGLADWFTGSEISFSIFYLGPVSLVAWFGGKRAGLWMAFASGLTWLVVELLGDVTYSHPATAYWNASVRLAFFVIVALLLSRVKVLTESLEETVAQRTAELTTEIAERSRATAQLQDSELRFRQLAENIREAFWITDPKKQQMLYISPGYEQIWGRSRESLYASPRTWLDAIHPEDRERVTTAALNQQTAGQYDEVYRIMRPDGTIRWIQDRAFPVRDESGEVYRIVGIAEDITARRQLEAEVLQANVEERRRLGHDLHDGLGQYLTGLAFRAKALQEKLAAAGALGAPEAEEIVSLINNAIRQTRMLAQGLDPVALAGGRLEVVLENLAADTGKLFDIECSFRCDDPVPPMQEHVALALYRIAQEAIHNAIKHAQAKRIDVHLSADAGHLCLRVQNCGAKIQLEGDGKAGMGFRIMDYRARSIGGNVRLITDSDLGTEVRCLVPLGSGADQEWSTI